MELILKAIPKWIITLLALLVFVILFQAFIYPREPIYLGKKLGSIGGDVDAAVETSADENHFPNATYDSDWIRIKPQCDTIEKRIGFDGLPKFVQAFYKIDDSTFPWGLNQYGDAHQSNGVLIDFDEEGAVFIRLPCSSKGADNVLHVGEYQNRNNSGIEAIFNRNDVSFRVLVWK